MIELLKRCERWLAYTVIGSTDSMRDEQVGLVNDLRAAIAREEATPEKVE